MNRRAFIAALMGASAVPMSAKSDAVPKHKVLVPPDELSLGTEAQDWRLWYTDPDGTKTPIVVGERE